MLVGLNYPKLIYFTESIVRSLDLFIFSEWNLDCMYPMNKFSINGYVFRRDYNLFSGLLILQKVSCRPDKDHPRHMDLELHFFL